MRTTQRGCVLLATLVLLAAPLAAQGGEWTYSGSLGVASGDYTLSETTTSVIVDSSISWKSDRFRISASIPVISQDTPYVTYVGGVATPTGRRLGMSSLPSAAQSGSGGEGSGGSGASRGGGEIVVPDPETQNFDKIGLGDPLLRADIQLGGSALANVGFFVAAKAPIADESSGFGTGEWDFAGGITLDWAFGDGHVFGEAGYWNYGDLSDLELEDPLSLTLGYGRVVGEGKWSYIASLWALSEGVDATDAPAEASFTLSRRLEPGRSVSLTLAAGLTDSTSDFRALVGWSTGL